MNLYIYSDESGVFDFKHNEVYVFAGLIITDKCQKDIIARKYTSIETDIRNHNSQLQNCELKANVLPYKSRRRLLGALSSCHKFCTIINQKHILKNIYGDKKTKQRYLDYAYKRAVKSALENLFSSNIIIPNKIEYIYFNLDEHSTATNGKYELKEALLQELKHGTYNNQYSIFYPPIIPSLKGVDLKYCNSSTNTLIRSSDIIANKIYGLAVKNELDKIRKIPKLNVLKLP